MEVTRELATEAVEEVAEEMGIDAEEMGIDAVTEYACPCSEGVSSSILVGVLVEGVFEVEDPHRLDEPGEPVSPARWRLLRESARGLLP